MAKINRSVKRALEVLQMLKDQRTAMTIVDICKGLGLPRSSAFDILNTLLAEGFIETTSESKKSYKLGLRAFEIGAAYLHHTDLSPTARPYLEKLMKISDSTAFLAIEQGGHLVYLDKVESPAAVRTSAQLGSRSSMYCTGLGKALLATYPEPMVKKIFDSDNARKQTEFTITDFPGLQAELARTRERGYAIDNREANVEVFCVAAPVYDVTNKAVAAISLAMLYSSLNEVSIRRFAGEVTESAMEISRRLGSTRERLY